MGQPEGEQTPQVERCDPELQPSIVALDPSVALLRISEIPHCRSPKFPRQPEALKGLGRSLDHVQLATSSSAPRPRLRPAKAPSCGLGPGAVAAHAVAVAVDVHDDAAVQ